ncbi:hypothetical protein [Fodinibius sediminis]|uniref:Coiled coil domain-containing protein n=1 Tax=Fodinibius sediminis TaxID=1214077 RepID=A0A521CVJ3_9BACT|nr:hypothetical protein [Fodinibius sediminis]SMO63432.1 hypothetical protein SAMN06265218_107144 [Fodinibius sediminis]
MKKNNNFATSTDERDTKRQQYIDSLTSKLNEWDEDLEALEIKMNKRIDKVKKTYRENLAELKARRERMSDKLSTLEESSEEAFGPIKKDLEALWKDTKRGLKNMREQMK